MPIYEYRCAKGHTFELFQSMSDDPVATCVECGAAAERVLSAPAVHFKGSGFYTTDYARKGAARKEKADDGGTGEPAAKPEAAKGDGASKGESKPKPASAD